MDQPPSSEGPAVGVINAESITEGIQNCQMSLEESRLRLAPLVKILDADDDDDDDDDDGGGSHAEFNDGQIVQGFMECIEQIFGSVDMLMVRLADSGLIPMDPIDGQNNANSSVGEDSVYLLMASNCISKASDFIGQNCLTLLEADSVDGPGPLDDHGSAGEEEGVRIQQIVHLIHEEAAVLRLKAN